MAITVEEKFESPVIQTGSRAFVERRYLILGSDDPQEVRDELLAETYHHSLAFVYSREEFVEQVDMHTARIEALFGVTPRVFRNTELIYNNDLAHFVNGMKDASGGPRFRGALTEGVESVLRGRTPDLVYRPPHTGVGYGGRPFALLLKNHRLSDDIAFRFANRSWSEWPLTPQKFARWIDGINDAGVGGGAASGAVPEAQERVCCLFMDSETFGEHHWEDTGVLRFLDELPGAVLEAGAGRNDFCTPSEAFDRFEARAVYDAPAMISWADTERDLSAWLGNAMQSNALYELHKLERRIRRAAAIDPAEAAGLLQDWRRLTTSDHFYFMCTKESGDGAVHRYFSPYESPYESYINFMNVLDNLRTRVGAV
ncbi:MAG: alpha-amylase [Phycisphaeraceae bacterium]|nr:MAG: alpha-amylase [Phycisphaeraceae bacterium]